MLRDEKPIEILGKKFIISKVLFTDAREIFLKSVPCFLSKDGYPKNEELYFKLLSYVAVPHDNVGQLRLTTKELINSHITSLKMGLLLEKEMWVYNNEDFLTDGSLSNLFDGIAARLPAWTTKILTLLLPSLSQKAKQL